MGRRLTNEEALSRAQCCPSFKPTTSYPGYNKVWMGECLKCGNEMPARLSDLVQGHGCRFCANKASGVQRAYSHDEAVIMASECCPDFIPTTPYPGANVKWTGKCRACGNPTAVRLSSMLRGASCCPTCYSLTKRPIGQVKVHLTAGEADHFGNLIKRKRSERNMTQCELAWEIGVSTKTLCGWETGDVPRRASSIEKAMKIAHILGMDEDEFRHSFEETTNSILHVTSGQAKRKNSVEKGQRFGRGVVVDPEAPRLERGYSSPLTASLECDCGNSYSAALSDLLYEKVMSCGCLRLLNAANSAEKRTKVFVEVGERYGKGLVTNSELRKGRLRAAELLCDCGTTYVASVYQLTEGTHYSCGCSRPTRTKGNVNVGDRFGSAILTRDTVRVADSPRRFAELECDCGTTFQVRFDALLSVKSCGCSSRKRRRSR